MSVTVHHASSLPAYEGPHEIAGMRFKHARAAMGVSAWGMNVLEIDAGATGYPVHDHVHDGQEEVYVVLKGTAVLYAVGAEINLQEGVLARVGPETTRHFTTETGVVLLALGGTPGAVYTPGPGM